MLLDDAKKAINLIFTASEQEALRLVDWFLAIWFHFGALSTYIIIEDISQLLIAINLIVNRCIEFVEGSQQHKHPMVNSFKHH